MVGSDKVPHCVFFSAWAVVEGMGEKRRLSARIYSSLDNWEMVVSV